MVVYTKKMSRTRRHSRSLIKTGRQKKELRVPSWPDKILLSSKWESHIYTVLYAMFGNDHRPVLRVSTIDLGGRELTIAFVTWNADLSANNCQQRLEKLKRCVLSFLSEVPPVLACIFSFQECRGDLKVSHVNAFFKSPWFNKYASRLDGFAAGRFANKKLLTLACFNDSHVRSVLIEDISPPTMLPLLQNPLQTPNFPAHFITIASHAARGAAIRVISCHAPFLNRANEVQTWWQALLTNAQRAMRVPPGRTDDVCLVGDLNSRLHFDRDTFPVKQFVFSSGQGVGTDEAYFKYLEDGNPAQSILMREMYDSYTGTEQPQNTHLTAIRSILRSFIRPWSANTDAYDEDSFKPTYPYQKHTNEYTNAAKRAFALAHRRPPPATKKKRHRRGASHRR